ncbi:hypothetical protein Ciccas_009665 [Cichlidogyrus casuarinus]|uniref:Uncharacterized protein n=1 Tax=Cichlidogyrus casuarinus TaxID=1844966 RepID=A0ABD2PWC2_9PLAT
MGVQRQLESIKSAGCEKMQSTYLRMVKELGAKGSAVASGIETMDEWMKNLLTDNGAIRNNFPTPRHQLSRVNFNNLVTLTVRINRGQTVFFEYIGSQRFYTFTSKHFKDYVLIVLDETAQILIEMMTLVVVCVVLSHTLFALCKCKSRNTPSIGITIKEDSIPTRNQDFNPDRTIYPLMIQSDPSACSRQSMSHLCLLPSKSFS